MFISFKNEKKNMLKKTVSQRKTHRKHQKKTGQTIYCFVFLSIFPSCVPKREI